MAIVAATALAVVCARSLRAAPAGHAAPSKRAALDNIAKRVLLPAYTDVAARSAELSTAIDGLASAPSPASLARARQAWSAALLAWRRTQAFAHGPVVDLNASSRIQFWPSRRTSVDRVLRSATTIDDKFVRELGANAVGLSALEMLLFDDRRDDGFQVASLSGAQGERERQYLRTVARELAHDTRRVADAWQRTGGYAASFNAGGQDSLNLLVNDLLSAIELGAQNRLRIVVDQYRAKASRPDLVEGALSATSQRGLVALLTGTRAAFSGGDGVGLDDYLAGIGPAAARRIDDQFRKAINAVEAIDGPLERAMEHQASVVEHAHAECRALEILLKTEVASLLGVTLTFKATDGD